MTPRGRGAVATLRLTGSPALLDSGEPVLFRAANGRSVAAQPLGRISFGWFGGASPEEIVVCRLDETTVELHCHGGDVAVERIVRELSERGVLVDPRPPLHGGLTGLLQQECRAAVSGASTLRTAKIAHAQASGVLQGAIETAIASLPDLERAGTSLEQIWQWRDVGAHLSVPWRVAVVGRPNVGKSRLMNALLGYDRSIVFDAPGTTRDVVTGETAFEGWPVQLADTAGLRPSVGTVEAEGIRRARDYLTTADLVLIVVDCSEPASPTDRQLIAEHPSAIVLGNKCDLPDRRFESGFEFDLRVSAATGAGLTELQAKMVRRLVPRAPGAMDAVPVSDRQVRLLNEALQRIRRNDRDGVRNALRELLS